MKKRTKLMFCAVLVLCFAVIWSLRFYAVNSNIHSSEVKIYTLGEAAPYEKDFFHRIDENRDGYVITVESAKLMTYKAFAHAHGVTESYISEEDSRPKYVYDIEVLIKNNNTQDDLTKGIDLINTRLVSSNASMQVDDRLFGLLYPHLSEQMSFSLKPESDMLMHLPYAEYEEDDYDILNRRDYYLLMSMYPTKKMIALKPSDN